MNYSDLVRAVQEGDERTASKLCKEALTILKRYLIANYDASHEDAEDAVQRMFEYVIPKIRNNEITNPDGLLSYMLSGVKHAYFKNLRQYEDDQTDPLFSEPETDEVQLWKLIDEERNQILKRCISYLKLHYRSLAEFIFDHPDADSYDIAEHFEISLNNAWIRKHRVIKQLSDCAQQKS